MVPLSAVTLVRSNRVRWRGAPDDVRTLRDLVVDGVHLGPAARAIYDVQAREALLLLDRPMSKETWLRLGGSMPDAQEELARVAAALRSGEGDLEIAGWEPPVLSVLINRDRAFVMWLADYGDAGMVAGDPAAAEDDAPEAFELSNGQVDEFPRSMTVTHPQALACVEAFLAGGRFATGVREIV